MAAAAGRSATRAKLDEGFATPSAASAAAEEALASAPVEAAFEFPPHRYRWALALMLVVLGAGFTWLITPLTGPEPGFLIAAFAATLAALVGGLWPGALVTVVAAALLAVQAYAAGTAAEAGTLARLLLLLPFGLLVAALSQALHDALARRQKGMLASEQAARAGDRLAAVLRECGIGLAELDAGLRYRWVHNPPLGPDAVQWLGQDAAALFGPTDAAPLVDAQRRVLASGAPLRAEIMLEGPAGRRAFEHAITPLFDAGADGAAQGRIVGLRCVLGDVSATQGARERQQRELALWHAAQELSPDAFELLEPVRSDAADGARILDFRWRYLNPAAAALLGGADAVQVGRRVLADHPGDAFQATRFAHWLEVMADGRPRRADFTRQDRGLATACQTLSVALDECLAVTTRDASEQAHGLQVERAAYTQLQRATRLKDEFLANLSHELRTPLNAIAGWAHVLGRAEADTDLVQRAAQAIGRNTRAQAALVDSLLDMSHLASGTLHIERRPLDVGAVLARAVDSVRAAAGAKWIAIDQSDIASGVQCLGEPARLQQVFAHLLDNAVKYTPLNGHVRVAMTTHSRSVSVVISDDGAGIEPALLPHLFTRFTQGDGSISRPHGGLGIGLAIAQGLALLHGGKVSVTSDGPGRGTRALVELPLLDMPQGAPPPAVSAADAPPGGTRAAERDPADATAPPVDARDARGPLDAAGHAGSASPHEGSLPLAWRRILVLEDEADSLELMSLLLRQQGAVVRAFDQPEQALAAAENGVFDLVISDLGLPGMDGLAFMRRLRERPLAPRAIAVTAYSDDAHRAQALAAGFARVEFKPIVPAQFLDVVIAEIGAAGR